MSCRGFKLVDSMPNIANRPVFFEVLFSNTAQHYFYIKKLLIKISIFTGSWKIKRPGGSELPFTWDINWLELRSVWFFRTGCSLPPALPLPNPTHFIHLCPTRLYRPLSLQPLIRTLVGCWVWTNISKTVVIISWLF